MIVPLTLGKFPLIGRRIALTGTLAILMSFAPHEAPAKGGRMNGPISRAEAAPVTSSQTEPTTETSGACGGKRYRDPITHRCRGPADFGN